MQWIVGLGNPGDEYARTRHNIGFMLVDLLAEKWHLTFKKQKMVEGFLAHGKVGEEEVYLLKPITFMNLSGEAVKKALDFKPVSIFSLLVIVDDADLPFGQMRLKEEGSPGGHNGLKSIEECLQTRSYPRLRLGIGRGANQLKDHVLTSFSKEEEGPLKDFLQRGVEIIELLLKEGMPKAMTRANQRQQEQTRNVKED